MSRSTVPVQIRPHLVPFFFEEFEGIESHYLNKRVKAAKISTNKPLGKIIRMLVEKIDRPVKPDNFQMFLSIEDRERSKEFFGQVYKCADGSNSFLHLPPAGMQLVNDHLEDLFRTSMVYYVEGHLADNPAGEIRKAIDLFLMKYDLYEYGFGIETLRRHYYRVLEDGAFLKRMQASGRVKATPVKETVDCYWMWSQTSKPAPLKKPKALPKASGQLQLF